MTTRNLLLTTCLAATLGGPLFAQVPPPGGFTITTVVTNPEPGTLALYGLGLLGFGGLAVGRRRRRLAS